MCGLKKSVLVEESWKEKGGTIFTLAPPPNGKTISCGRDDGSVQRWSTDGKVIQGTWTGHSDCVRSVSWSPSGDYIASGSDYGKILIRKAKNRGDTNQDEPGLGALHIHLRAIELHQAGTRQFASGVARQASFLSVRSKTWGTGCTLLCGRWIAAHCTLPGTLCWNINRTDS